jgi:hypothetical protein
VAAVLRGRDGSKLVGMRRFLTLRWLGIHAAMLVIVAAFCALGWWQLRRAEGGNALSWGYTFEWPLFAGFVVVFWVRTMRDELRDVRAAGGESSPAAPEVILPTAIRTGRDAEPGGGGGAGGADGRGADGRGDADVGDDEELAAYNAYLARLNAEARRQGGWLVQRGSRRQAGWTGASRGGAADQRAADQRPADQRPADQRPADQRPADQRATDQRRS